MNSFESSTSISGIINKIINALTLAAYVVIVCMLIIVIGNIIGRFFFNKPLLGTVELVELGMVVIGFFAMPYSTMHNANVRVEIITVLISKRSKAILGIIASFLSALIIGFITYQAFINAFYYLENLNQATTILSIPFAPFRFIMAFGCLILFLRVLCNVFISPPHNDDY